MVHWTLKVFNCEQFCWVNAFDSNIHICMCVCLVVRGQRYGMCLC